MGKDIVDSFSNLELSEKDALIATLIEETRNLRDTVTKLETQVNHEKNSALPYTIHPDYWQAIRHRR